MWNSKFCDDKFNKTITIHIIHVSPKLSRSFVPKNCHLELASKLQRLIQITPI